MIEKIPFSFCSDADIASVLPFKKENIRRRYKTVPSKIILYNGMQVITFMKLNNISEDDLKLALRVLSEFKDDTELLFSTIKEKTK